MLVNENKALIEKYIEAINGKEKSAELLGKFIAESDSTLIQHILGTEAAFPKYGFLAEDVVAADDKVVVRFTIRGTQHGAFMGIPATGKAIQVPAIIIYRIQNGKIAEHWMQVDSISMLQQLGAMP